MNLKIKLIPYERLKKVEFSKLVDDIKENTIILVDAKLTPEEETNLIKETMENVNERFAGIELSSMDIKENKTVINRFRNMLVEKIIGKKRGLTVIGPARIIHRIKRNPEELLLYM